MTMVPLIIVGRVGHIVKPISIYVPTHSSVTKRKNNDVTCNSFESCYDGYLFDMHPRISILNIARIERWKL